MQGDDFEVRSELNTQLLDVILIKLTVKSATAEGDQGAGGWQWKRWQKQYDQASVQVCSCGSFCPLLNIST